MTPQICPLITKYNSNAIYKCDWLNRKYEKIETPLFNFRNHTTVQIEDDIFAISFEKLEVTKIEDLLQQLKGLQTTTLGSLNKERFGHTSCHSLGKSIFMIGGYGLSERPVLGKRYHSTAYRFDIATGRFIVAPSLNQARYLAASCALNEKLYVIAGSDGKNSLSSIELLDISRKKTKWRIFTLPALTPCDSLLFSALNES